jgi:chemotaxis protein CheD
VTAAIARTDTGLRTPPSVGVQVSALPVTYVHPGQLAVSATAASLTTILGSCVAVCLHDPRLRIGGLNHYLLATEPPSPDLAGRYAPVAIPLLVEGMLAHGASIRRLTAHIVGGAAVLAAFENERNHIGARNVEAAREMMAGYGIRVVSMEVGGTRGRKLLFSPREGAITVQLIGR